MYTEANLLLLCQIRGSIVVQQYHRHPDVTTTPDGWFPTGDVASLDPLGYMLITDRSKDVIKSGGEWISSIELENVAMGHPGVLEAAVIGVPDVKWTERPLLVVVPKSGIKGGDQVVLVIAAFASVKYGIQTFVATATATACGATYCKAHCLRAL